MYPIAAAVDTTTGVAADVVAIDGRHGRRYTVVIDIAVGTVVVTASW